MENSGLIYLQREIQPLREKIINHPIYDEIRTIDDLKVFMEHHVFAVWDFMSALKVMQQKLTSIHIPWIPKGNPNTRFLINSIVLEEESGLDQHGNRTSHFELYLEAMKQAGCDMIPVLTLLEKLKEGKSFSSSLYSSNILGSAEKFIRNTVETSILGDKIYLQAAVFTFGRRNLLPDMFVNFVDELGLNNPNISIFKYYIGLHARNKLADLSNLAVEMTIELCGSDEQKWTEATYAVKRSLHARLELWDSILETLRVKVG